MEEKKVIKKHYSNKNFTVSWEPQKCTHSKKCWKGLIAVFDPREKPWIRLEKAEDAQILAQINECPSKALTYKLHNS